MHPGSRSNLVMDPIILTGMGRSAGERCLLGVEVAHVLEARALVHKVRVGRQVVLAEGGIAGLACKQQPARLCGRPAALAAVVVRALPRLHCVQLLRIPNNSLLHWPDLYGHHMPGLRRAEVGLRLPPHMAHLPSSTNQMHA